MSKKSSHCMIVTTLLALLLLFAGCTDTTSEAGYPREYTDEVEYWAGTYNLDPNLVYAVILTESSFDPNAVSSAGAIGLMQMTSDTFDWVKSKIAPSEELAFEALHEPNQSIRFGCYLLNYCMEKYDGDISTVAAAYHSGMGTVDGLLETGEHSDDGQILRSFPFSKMNNYVRKINKNYEEYNQLYEGTTAA